MCVLVLVLSVGVIVPAAAAEEEKKTEDKQPPVEAAEPEKTSTETPKEKPAGWKLTMN